MKKVNPLSKKQLIEKIIAQEKELTALQLENKNLKKNLSLFPDNDTDVFSLKKIIALMPGNVYWKNKDGVYLGCNNNLAQFVGISSPDEIIGKRNEDIVDPKYAAIVDKIDKDIMNSKKGKYIEETVEDLNKNLAIFYTHKIPMFNREGDVMGLLGISLNITAYKNMEKELKVAKKKAEASNRAKSRFLAAVNHELRTPLTGILGLIHFLKEKKLTPNEEKIVINDLDNCAQNLLSLVNDVLDFSQLEAKKYTVTKTVVELQTVVNEVFRMLAVLANNKGLDFRIDWDPTLLPHIVTDLHAFRQILINITNNAIKYTDKGEVIITVRCLAKKQHKVQLEIAISDTGRGIPENKLEQIFKPFQQLEDTYTRQSSRSGTGLGLAIVKDLAALINVDIRVKSKIGKGSTFSLIGEFNTKYPQAQADAPLTLPAISPIISKNKKCKVLLIEDDQLIQYVHKKMLQDLGCHVDVAVQGYDAIHLLDNHDIVFVDIGLPDIAGFDVIKIIREKYQRPIIALTGYTGEQEKSACLTAGANEVANKPILVDALKDILIRYVYYPLIK